MVVVSLKSIEFTTHNLCKYEYAKLLLLLLLLRYLYFHCNNIYFELWILWSWLKLQPAYIHLKWSKNLHLKWFNLSWCLVDPGLRWIYAGLSLHFFQVYIWWYNLFPHDNISSCNKWLCYVCILLLKVVKLKIIIEFA